MPGGLKKTKSRKTGKKSSTKLMDALRDFVRSRGTEYLKDHNISSIGIGYKMKDGKPTREIAVQFTVKQKAAPEELENLDTILIPKSFMIGDREIPTDVIQRKFTAEYRLVAEAQTSDRKKRMDPILPGISVANAKESAGTIGCIVYDRADGTPYILSNWHVLNGPNGAVGDDIMQPGPYDDNRNNRFRSNRLGKLVRSHLGHAGDCAVATIEDRDMKPDIIDLGIVVEKLGEPELGDKVIKSGRTTGITHGIVTRVHTITKIDYEGSFGEQEIGGIEIGLDPRNVPDNGEVSMGGDSGSVWLFKADNGEPTNILAGLHFAGEGPEDPNEHAIACYPKSVFEELEISLSPPSEVQRVPGTGFSQNFLSVQVGLPELSVSNKKKAFTLDGSEVIDYTHFSLGLNKIRQFAFWVGWNIDGGNIVNSAVRAYDLLLMPVFPKSSKQVMNYMQEIAWIEDTLLVVQTCFGVGLQKRIRPTKIRSSLQISLHRWMTSTKHKEADCGDVWKTLFTMIRKLKTSESAYSVVQFFARTTVNSGE